MLKEIRAFRKGKRQNLVLIRREGFCDITIGTQKEQILEEITEINSIRRRNTNKDIQKEV